MIRYDMIRQTHFAGNLLA